MNNRNIVIPAEFNKCQYIVCANYINDNPQIAQTIHVHMDIFDYKNNELSNNPLFTVEFSVPINADSQHKISYKIKNKDESQRNVEEFTKLIRNHLKNKDIATEVKIREFLALQAWSLALSFREDKHGFEYPAHFILGWSIDFEHDNFYIVSKDIQYVSEVAQ